MLRKKITDYNLYVFDLDGTLYSQPRLRFIMASRLLGYYVLHPHRIGELFLLQDFRKTKDSWEGESNEEKVIEDVARRHNKDKKIVEDIVKHWIYDNPLSAVAATKFEKMISFMEELRQSGKKVVILSDYPTKDKLDAMKVTVDAQYSTTDERIGELKPSPKGLMVVMSDFGENPENTLMIGDRDVKDGASARSAGVDFALAVKGEIAES